MTYDVFVPNAPPTRECDATYPYSYFTCDTKLSYRHIQFNKIRGWVAPKNKRNKYKKISGFFLMKYDFMAPNTPPIRECDATYPCSHFTCNINLSYRHSKFKKIRGWVTQKDQRN